MLSRRDASLGEIGFFYLTQHQGMTRWLWRRVFIAFNQGFNGFKFQPQRSTGLTSTLLGVRPNSLTSEISPICREPVLPSSGEGLTTTTAPSHSNITSTCNSDLVTTKIGEQPLSVSILVARATRDSPFHFTSALGWPNLLDAPAANTMAGTPFAIGSQILGNFTTNDHSLNLTTAFVNLHDFSTTH